MSFLFENNEKVYLVYFILVYFILFYFIFFANFVKEINPSLFKCKNNAIISIIQSQNIPQEQYLVKQPDYPPLPKLIERPKEKKLRDSMNYTINNDDHAHLFLSQKQPKKLDGNLGIIIPDDI
jgi:hypothetical protein